ncbi:MAG TPA: NrfD/PsrC family molybdoenzyme membrane anchor subunit [Trebonia sp.]|jgi:formate-dependent nitrite reductase membrane component NrfD
MKRRAENPMVPKAEFTSYYGQPVLNQPVWESRDIAGYLFLGGLAGGSSLLGAGAHLTGRPVLGAVAKTGAAAAAGLSLAALVHDLGRPERFLHMLRVFKVTSPMSVGSWLLSAYGPTAGAAAVTALTGRLPRIGALATGSAALLGPAVAAYTAALISDTAVPSWHDGYREMPFVFTGSGAMAAGGLGLLGTSVLGAPGESAPARNLALLGAGLETAALEHLERGIGLSAEPYSKGRAGKYVKAGKILAAAGSAGALIGTLPGGIVPDGLVPDGVRRVVTAASGAALVAASAATRWGIFHAGLASAADPKYTVVPQRERLAERAHPERAPSGQG